MLLITVIEGSVEGSVMASGEGKRNDVLILIQRMDTVAARSATATARSASALGHCPRALTLLATNA